MFHVRGLSAPRILLAAARGPFHRSFQASALGRIYSTTRAGALPPPSIAAAVGHFSARTFVTLPLRGARGFRRGGIALGQDSGKDRKRRRDLRPRDWEEWEEWEDDEGLFFNERRRHSRARSSPFDDPPRTDHKKGKKDKKRRHQRDKRFSVGHHLAFEQLSPWLVEWVGVFEQLVAAHGGTREALAAMSRQAQQTAAKRKAPTPVACDLCGALVQDGNMAEHVAGKRHQRMLARTARGDGEVPAGEAASAADSGKSEPAEVGDGAATKAAEASEGEASSAAPASGTRTPLPFTVDEFIPLGGDEDAAKAKRRATETPVDARIRAREAKALPWVRREYSEDPCLALHEQIEDFVAYIRPTKAEHLMRMEIVERVRQTVKSVWPGAEVNAFGSFETGLYLPTSDVDLVVYGQWEAPPLKTLARALEESGIVKSIKVIDKARVPIIKFVDATSNVPVDIGFNLPNGPAAAEFVKNEIRKHSAFLPLAYVLKQYLSQRALNEVFTGGLGSYSLLLMIASFLQMQPRNRRLPPQSHPPNLGVALIEFFELYGKDFNYIKTGISVRNGGSYFPKSSRGWFDQFKPTLLAIEDPHNPDNDISRNSFAIAHVRQAFRHGFDTLTGEITAAHDWRERGVHSGPPVLSRILRIESDVVVFRSWVHDNWGPRVDAAAASNVPATDEMDGGTHEGSDGADEADGTSGGGGGGGGRSVHRKRQSSFGAKAAKRSRIDTAGRR